MINFYYLLGIPLMFIYLARLINPKRYYNDIVAFKKYKKEYETKDWDDYSPGYKSLIKRYMFIGFCGTAWLFIGILSSQWVMYLVIVLTNLLSVPLSKLGRSTKTEEPIYWLYHLWVFSSVTFLVVNHFHLDINISQLILQYLKGFWS